MRAFFNLIAAAVAVVVIALAIPTSAVVAADSPDGLKCPMTTMNGKWLDLADFPGAVNGDCVPLSMASNATKSTPACDPVIAADFTGVCRESGGDVVQYEDGVETWRG